MPKLTHSVTLISNPHRTRRTHLIHLLFIHNFVIVYSRISSSSQMETMHFPFPRNLFEMKWEKPWHWLDNTVRFGFVLQFHCIECRPFSSTSTHITHCAFVVEWHTKYKQNTNEKEQQQKNRSPNKQISTLHSSIALFINMRHDTMQRDTYTTINLVLNVYCVGWCCPWNQRTSPNASQMIVICTFSLRPVCCRRLLSHSLAASLSQCWVEVTKWSDCIIWRHNPSKMPAVTIRCNWMENSCSTLFPQCKLIVPNESVR